MAKPGLVTAEIIEIQENRDLAERYGAFSVPKTYINEQLTAEGLEPEEYFVASLLKGERVLHDEHEHGNVLEADPEKTYDIIILGGGPAGLTAAIYAQRSGLQSVVIEQATVGGQIALTPAVENYPGFPKIAGKTLVELMVNQARQYVPVVEGVALQSLRRNEEGTFLVNTSRGTFQSQALIIATGASHRNLGVEGEKRLSGRGVSYCSTCDGYMFKDGHKVLVVGGGSAALTDALYLESIGAVVTIIHRGETLRAEDALQKNVKQRGIPVLFNTEVLKINGGSRVQSVSLINNATGETSETEADAVFIAVGYKPNTETAEMLGLEMSLQGYIKTDLRQKTSLENVYAAGDVTGGVKQITVAVGQGSVAAISAFEDLSATRLRS